MAAQLDQVARDSLRGGFGNAGWRMILVSMFSYFAYAGWCVDGMNVFSTALAADHGWDPGRLLTLAAPGGLLGVVGSAVFGHLVVTLGPRRIMSLSLLCMAAVVAWFGRMQSIWEYAIILMLLNLFGSGFGFIAPGTLLAHWFPKKKGMALAIATSGYPLATAGFVPLIAWMFSRFGVTASAAVWAVILGTAAAVSYLLVRDTPEELGRQPDNEPSVGHDIVDVLANYRSRLTVGRLLRDRDQWLISVGWGCLWMVTVGVVVQLVPRMMSIGYSQSEAIGLLSMAALCALPGSVLWGYLDQRLGTRIASGIYALVYIATLLLLIAGFRHPAGVFLTVLLVGLGLGGIKSLITSMTVTVYGRYDFSAAYGVIIPASIIVRTACFPIMGLALTWFGSLTAAYVAFIFVDVAALAMIAATRGTCKGSQGALPQS